MSQGNDDWSSQQLLANQAAIQQAGIGAYQGALYGANNLGPRCTAAERALLDAAREHGLEGIPVEVLTAFDAERLPPELLEEAVAATAEFLKIQKLVRASWEKLKRRGFNGDTASFRELYAQVQRLAKERIGDA